MASYQVKRGEKVYGPFVPAKLREMAQVGKLLRTDLISQDSKLWHKAEAVAGLFPNPTIEELPDPVVAQPVAAPQESFWAVRAPAPAQPTQAEKPTKKRMSRNTKSAIIAVASVSVALLLAGGAAWYYYAPAAGEPELTAMASPIPPAPPEEEAASTKGAETEAPAMQAYSPEVNPVVTAGDTAATASDSDYAATEAEVRDENYTGQASAGLLQKVEERANEDYSAQDIDQWARGVVKSGTSVDEAEGYIRDNEERNRILLLAYERSSDPSHPWWSGDRVFDSEQAEAARKMARGEIYEAIIYTRVWKRVLEILEAK